MFYSTVHSKYSQGDQSARTERTTLRAKARRALELAVAFLTLEDDYDGWDLSEEGLLSDVPVLETSARRSRHPHQQRLRSTELPRRAGAVQERFQHCVSPLRPRRDGEAERPLALRVGLSSN